MKGYGCALCWPTPAHRPMGDIDIFCPESVKIDSLVEKEWGLRIDKSNPHHSIFSFNGVTVENHHTVLDIHIHRQNELLEPLLEELAQEEPRKVMIGDEELHLPPVRFQAIHLLRHTSLHFPEDNVTLRQIVDWATFVINTSTVQDWKFMTDIANRYKMNKFLDAMNAVCVDYLGFPSDMFPISQRDDEMRDRLLSAVLNSPFQSVKKASEYSNTFTLLCSRVQYCRKNGWKYKLAFDENAGMVFYQLCREFINKQGK